jgi:type I restriction enzyme S subunit
MRAKGIKPKDDKWKEKYSEPQPVKNIDDLPSIPDGWCWLTMLNVSDINHYSISSGPFGSALGKKDYQENGIPVIRGKNIQEGKFILDDFVYITQEKALELRRSSAYPNDLIVVAVGSSGQVALVPNDLPFAILSQNCNKFTLNESIILPKFTLFLFQSYFIKSQLWEKTTDTVRQFLSLTNLKNIVLPIPGLKEQQEIVRKLEKMMQFADRVEEQVKEAEKKLEKFNQSVLAKAFKGKLVPQDPNDEPASVLLGKIQQEKNSTTIKKIKK